MTFDSETKKEILKRTFGSYMTKPFVDPQSTVQRAKGELHDVPFDTIVVTGTSGLVFGPALAYAMNKRLFVVRKQNDGSHTSAMWEGTVGCAWIFVDDFVSTGRTFARCVQSIDTWTQAWKTSTEYLGRYLYEKQERWSPATTKHMENARAWIREDLL